MGVDMQPLSLWMKISQSCGATRATRSNSASRYIVSKLQWWKHPHRSYGICNITRLTVGWTACPILSAILRQENPTAKPYTSDTITHLGLTNISARFGRTAGPIHWRTTQWQLSQPRNDLISIVSAPSPAKSRQNIWRTSQPSDSNHPNLPTTIHSLTPAENRFKQRS